MAIHSDRDYRRNVRAQIGLTLLGSLALFLCIAAMSIVWIVNSKQTDAALVAASGQFRKEQASVFKERIAVLIRPLWTLTRRFATELDGGLSDTLLSRDYHTTVTKINEALPAFYAATLRETHMRSVAPDGSNRVLNNVIGVVAGLALDENYLPVSDLPSCKKGLFQSVILDSADPDSDVYIIDLQYPNVSATAGVSRVFRFLDTKTQTVGPIIRSMPALPPVVVMGSLWAGHQLPDFANFSWFGPHNPNIGWGNHLEGNVPIYDASRRQIGRLGAAISLGKSVAPLLQGIIAEGGALTKGGQGAVYTADGLVIGLSESGASPSSDSGQAVMLADVVADSATGEAIAQIKGKFGDACPSIQHLVTSMDRLIDITPFRSEEYGLPPLGQRWCLMMSVPRKNVFKHIDEANKSSLVVAMTAGIGFLGAIALLSRSLVLAHRAEQRMNAERRLQYQKRIEKARKEMQTFACPMSVMHWQDFCDMKRLDCHEVWRDCGKLKVLDSISAVRDFQSKQNIIALISHQWLGFSLPDNADGVQLRAMQHIIQKIVDANPGKEVHVWLDYISVAQHHSGMMMLAVHTLPAYVSVVDQFAICAPDAWHDDDSMWCNLATYKARGWCRTEMLAKLCSSGMKDTYICAGKGDDLKPFTQADFDRLSLNVFEGDFTVREDMETLVEPILGLYSLILKQTERASSRALPSQQINMVRARIEEEKQAFFPEGYCPDLDKPDDVRFLFGPLVQLMEEAVAAQELSGAQTASIDPDAQQQQQQEDKEEDEEVFEVSRL